MKIETILKRWVNPKYASYLCLLNPSNYTFLVESAERERIKVEINKRLNYLSFTKHFQHPDGVPRCGLNLLSKRNLLVIVQVTGEDFRKETDVFRHKCLYLITHSRLMKVLYDRYDWYYGNIAFFRLKEKHPDDKYEAFNDGIKSALGQLKSLTEQGITPDTLYSDIGKRSKIINIEIAKVISCVHQIQPYIGF